jgi:ubiquinone/menaquinone biosynthesis C-methylase UbiE
MNGEECMLNIYNYCSQNLSSLEIWPAFYKIRFEELKRFQNLFPKKRFSSVLEIGCGIGYQSALLSCISNKVVASDIDLGNMVKHSRGLDATRGFLKNLPVNNIEIVNADAVDLPFGDETFDFIYCSFSFQYVPNKDKALAEIKRVMKKGGYFFCILPTTAYVLANGKKYYGSAFKKLTALGKNKTPPVKDITGMQMDVVKTKRFKLLPPTDDESNNFFTELFAYSTIRWRRLFKKNGHNIILEKRDSTSVIFMTKK